MQRKLPHRTGFRWTHVTSSSRLIFKLRSKASEERWTRFRSRAVASCQNNACWAGGARCTPRPSKDKEIQEADSVGVLARRKTYWRFEWANHLPKELLILHLEIWNYKFKCRSRNLCAHPGVMQLRESSATNQASTYKAKPFKFSLMIRKQLYSTSRVERVILSFFKTICNFWPVVRILSAKSATLRVHKKILPKYRPT